MHDTGQWWDNPLGRATPATAATGLFEGLQQRRRRAMEIHDNVVQNITTAKMALDRGEEQAAREERERALDRSHAIISDLLGPESDGLDVQASDLRRESAAADAR